MAKAAHAAEHRSTSGASERSVRRRGGLRGHFHRAPQHPVRLASLAKNRQSKEREESRSELPFSRWRDLTQVRTWSRPGKRECSDACRIRRSECQSGSSRAAIHNRMQRSYGLITCEKQRIPLNSRSQSPANRRSKHCKARKQAVGRSEFGTVRLTAQLEENTGTTLSARGPLLDVTERAS